MLRLFGYLYEDYHDARSLEHKVYKRRIYLNSKSVVTETNSVFGRLMEPFWKAMITGRDALPSYEHSAVHSKYTPRDTTQ